MSDKVIGTIQPDTVAGSMTDIMAATQDNVEYREIPGFKTGQRIIIGSLTAGDLIEWSEANEGEAKRTAGLRLICKSLCSPPPENKRYAADDKNIAVFRAMPHKATEAVVKEILKLNGMHVKENREAKND